MWRSLKRNFLAGLLVLLPIYLTYLILAKLFLFIDGILNRIATRALVAALNLPFDEDRIIYGLGFITLFLVIILSGRIARHYLGKKFLIWLNVQLDQVPIVKNIYKTLRQIFEALFSGNREAFQKPVMVEYPRRGLYTIGFQTMNSGGLLQDHIEEETVTIFVPSTPNPTTGFVVVIPKSQVKDINLNVEEAMKFIISGGVISSRIANLPEENQTESDSKTPDNCD